MDAEIDRQVEMGILEPVQFSEWATPVVPVSKADGSVRLCGDYKVTVNQETKVDTYPLPRIEDIHASLAGGEVFISHMPTSKLSWSKRIRHNQHAESVGGLLLTVLSYR